MKLVAIDLLGASNGNLIARFNISVQGDDKELITHALIALVFVLDFHSKYFQLVSIALILHVLYALERIISLEWMEWTELG
jgi:hypothetical protein